jgi:hypothetical protein
MFECARTATRSCLSRSNRVKDQTPGYTPSAVDDRSARLAANEAVFRAGNERIDATVGDAHGTTTFMCECGDPQCFQMIDLTKEEYEAVRAHPAHFFVVRGHEDLTAGEVVVEEAASFTVVEKRGAERAIVERGDPRAS